VFGEELEAAERAHGVTVGDGDILLVRTGHPRRLAELGPWDTAAARAGLHPTAMPFVAERRVAALGSDGNSDAAPSTTEGVAFPVHVLAINAMGVRLWTTCSWRTSGRRVRPPGVGSSCSWPRRCGSSAGRARPSTRSRSCSASHPCPDIALPCTAAA
jgi:Putative cyclase